MKLLLSISIIPAAAINPITAGFIPDNAARINLFSLNLKKNRDTSVINAKDGKLTANVQTADPKMLANMLCPEVFTALKPI